MIVREEILRVVESPLVKIATAAERMPGSIKLCYGESDLPTPDFICTAAHEAVLAGHTFYTHTAGSFELREAIAAKVLDLQGVEFSPSEVMATVGGTMAIHVAIRAMVGPGDNAVIVSPAYAIYANSVLMSGAEPRLVPLGMDGSRYVLDLDRIARAIDANTRMLIVNSPSNPTGWMATPAEQKALVELVQGHNLVLLSDEVYERLVFDGGIAPSIARVMPDKDRVIVVNSFSKTYNMTGWRLGWVQASEPFIRQLYKAAEFITSNPTAFVQQAGIVALRDGEPFVQGLRAHYAARRTQVTQALRSIPGVTLREAQGGFYVFPRFPGAGDSSAFCASLLDRAAVALAPGSAFGDGGEGHVRICFAASEATLGTALSRLTAALHG